MARETKVGLLAGLAFIICFAVILANRGSNAPPGLASPFLPNGGVDLPKLVQRQQAVQDNTRLAGRQLSPNTQVRPPRSPSSQINTQPVSPSGENDFQTALQGANDGASGVTSPITLADNTRHGDVVADVHRGLQDGEAIRPDAANLLRPDGNVKMTATVPAPSMPVVATQAEQEPNHYVRKSEPTTPSLVSHTVEPGDTLSKIAAARYGTKSLTAVEAIYQANRHILKDEDSIRVGMVLTIPPLGDATLSGTPNRAGPQPAGERSADSQTRTSDAPVQKVAETVSHREKSQGFRWYQIKKNEGFASIAREQLGDARRWKEIHELNKDKFPDPQKIREGVRIKLPNTSLAEAGKEKRR